MRANLPERLKRSVRRQFGALSLLKVESTVCFQRKRSRSRAVTRERLTENVVQNGKISNKIGKSLAFANSYSL